MFDYHIHSHFSDDGYDTMEALAESAVKAGLSQMAITDHFDPDYPDPSWSSNIDFTAYQNEMELTEYKFKDRIKVIKGLEIGIQHGGTLGKCRTAAKSYPYDFILGSFHCAEGFELSCGGFFDNRTVEDATLAFYNYCFSCINNFDDFDVLAHVNVVDRYGAYIPSSDVYIETVSELLKLLIDKGKGIELNTSSFRYGMGNHTTPSDEILRLYYDLGGEIITIGSDAHRVRDVASGLAWGFDKLRSIGFKYITTFDQRVPKFVKL